MIGPVFTGVLAWLPTTTPTVQPTNATTFALLSQAESAPMLDPPTRAVLLMALLAFVILGMGLIAGAMIGGRWVRRLGGEELTKPMRLHRTGDQGATAEASTPRTAPVVGPNWNRQGDTSRLDASGAETQVV